MNFQEAFATIREKIIDADVSAISGKTAVQVNLTGASEGIFYVEINNGTLAVEPYDYHDNDVVMTISAENFLKLMEGKLDPVFAFTTGKLKAEGNLDKAMELQKLAKSLKKA